MPPLALSVVLCQNRTPPFHVIPCCLSLFREGKENAFYWIYFETLSEISVNICGRLVRRVSSRRTGSHTNRINNVHFKFMLHYYIMQKLSVLSHMGRSNPSCCVTATFLHFAIAQGLCLASFMHLRASFLVRIIYMNWPLVELCASFAPRLHLPDQTRCAILVPLHIKSYAGDGASLNSFLFLPVELINVRLQVQYPYCGALHTYLRVKGKIWCYQCSLTAQTHFLS